MVFVVGGSTMRVIRDRPGESHENQRPAARSVLAIGNFDGLHLGHRALIDRCHLLRTDDELVAIMTFEPLPIAWFHPEAAPARLTTVYQKLSLMAEMGVGRVWLMRFGQRLAGMSAREFAEIAIHQQMNARCVVVGEDFRFGKGREGDIETLRDLGREFGFEVSTVSIVESDGLKVSSSEIREKLGQGDFEGAEQFLGRPFTMEGHVVRGAQLGRKLGFPTANLRVRAHPTPLHGVFAVMARLPEGDWLPAVSNLGWRPVVGGGELLLEVHLFDFDEDIYGERLEVLFVAKLRDELDFATMDDLVEQMNTDAEQARACLSQYKVAGEPADK